MARSNLSTWLVLGVLACGHSAPKGSDAFIPGRDGAALPQTTSALELHGGPSRAGAFVEPSFTHATAAGLHVDSTFDATYDGSAFAAPLYYDDGGGSDLVIAASEANVVSAFSPTGQAVWQLTLGAPQPMPNPSEGAPCGDINPLGITGTPVIDAANRIVYVDAMIDDGSAHHRVFALSLDNGSAEAGWPVDVGTTVTTPIPFLPAPQNQRGGLTLHDGHVYVPYGGHSGDCGDYHGWIVAVPTDDPQHPTAFATTQGQAGAWSPGGVSSDGSDVFAVFGNGTPTSTWGQADMVGRFGSGASFSDQPADFWVPLNWMTFDSQDIDMTGPAIPLDLPGSTPEHLLVSYGKDGNVYVTDRDNLGGITNPVAQIHASSSEIINTSALYSTTAGVYTVMRGAGVNCPDGNANHNLVAVKITAGAPPTLSVAWCAGSGAVGSPIVTTTDGQSDPIVWAIGAEGDQRIHGYDGDTGGVVFAGGGSGDAMQSTSRFITPMVAKGRLFVAADDRLYAFTAE